MLEKLSYPSIRKMFIPQVGFTYFDSDFAQADARVVAWDSGCQRLKDLFHDPDIDIHAENAVLIFKKLTKNTRQLAKNGVHAVNYYVKAKTLAVTLGISPREAQLFIDRWLTLNPEIHDWHERVQAQLYENGTITNIYGFRRQYFDRVDKLLPEALAWKGQSTVAIAIKLAMNNLIKNIEEEKPNDFHVLMQVHDSILGQFRDTLYPEIRVRIRDEMQVTVPYDDPLLMPCDLKASRKSWGHCKLVAGRQSDGTQLPWTDSQKFCVY